MTKFVVFGPLDEADLHDRLRTHPVCAQAREADGFGEGRFVDFDLIELGAQVLEEPGVEAGANLAGEHKVVAVVITDQQSTEADSIALRIGETTDDEFLRQLAFHLQPVARAARLVNRSTQFGDYTFPAFGLRALEG